MNFLDTFYSLLEKLFAQMILLIIRNDIDFLKMK